MITSRTILVGAALAGAASVALGAFGAHALRAALDEQSLATWRTAIDYAFWHALALLGAAALARDGVTRTLAIAAGAFVVGIVLFSGSLCALALGAPRAFGIVTPFGGVALIVGWLALAAHALRSDGAPRS
ncbi:MAG: DUF423 domain-containing protein [Rhodanobacteraceae bacterium]